MSTPSNYSTLAALTAAALLLAGCGGSGSSTDTTNGSPGAPASTAAPPLSDEQKPPNRLVVKVSIEGGQVTPTNVQLTAAVGEPIVIQVDSDAPDKLHVHSNPEHEFTVEPKPGQSFQFTVEIPGKVDVELHELERTIATIAVQ